jgi:hypothetical protein
LPTTTLEIHETFLKSKPLGIDNTLERYGPIEQATEDNEEIQVEELFVRSNLIRGIVNFM